jgi:DNA-binding PadR family transcriptional regulator
MVRPRKASVQTLAVLAALLSRQSEWRHGYDLTKETGLKSGTLYPVLMRLTDQGWLEAEWQPPARLGAPARHAYRLTGQGVAAAHAAIAEATPGHGRLAAT